MEEYGEDLECDLQRYFQVNLVEDIGTPRLTWRRLGLFVDRLITKTPGSYLSLAKATPEEALWDLKTHVMALLADRLAVSNFLAGQGLVARGMYKQNPVPEPKPVPRPGVSEAPPEKAKGLKAVIRTLFPAQAAKAGI